MHRVPAAAASEAEAPAVELESSVLHAAPVIACAVAAPVAFVAAALLMGNERDGWRAERGEGGEGGSAGQSTNERSVSASLLVAQSTALPSDRLSSPLLRVRASAALCWLCGGRRSSTAESTQQVDSTPCPQPWWSRLRRAGGVRSSALCLENLRSSSPPSLFCCCEFGASASDDSVFDRCLFGPPAVLECLASRWACQSPLRRCLPSVGLWDRETHFASGEWRQQQAASPGAEGHCGRARSLRKRQFWSDGSQERDTTTAESEGTIADRRHSPWEQPTPTRAVSRAVLPDDAKRTKQQQRNTGGSERGKRQQRRTRGRSAERKDAARLSAFSA